MEMDAAREYVYGMPYSEWKANHQGEATPEQLADMVKVDRERWAKVIKTAGIKPD